MNKATWIGAGILLAVGAGAIPAYGAYDTWYFDGNPRVVSAFTLLQGWYSQDAYPRLLGDINNDGAVDIVAFGATARFIRWGDPVAPFSTGVATGGGFTHQNGWVSQDQYPRALGDINGDGLDDMIGFGAIATYWQPSTGTGFGPTQTVNMFSTADGWMSQDEHPRFLADMNNDNRADIVGFKDGLIWISLSTPTGFDPPTTSSGFAGFFSQDVFPRVVADMTGDGRADIVGFGQNDVFLATRTNTGFTWTNLGSFMTHASGWTSQSSYPRRVADVDGDGRLDIVGYGHNQVYVRHQTSDTSVEFKGYPGLHGSHTFTRGWDSNATPRFVGDANGDGAADVVGFDARGIVWTPAEQRTAPSNPIVTENLQPGTRSWEPGCAVGTPCLGSDAVGQMEAYFSQTSVQRGQAINLHVSSSETRNYQLDLYRFGYYQGHGARLITSVSGLTAHPQTPCYEISEDERWVCPWAASYPLQTDPTWTTGIYMVKLTRDDGFVGYATFCLRADDRNATFRYQQPVTTYHAYNNYPEGAGKSFYGFNSPNENLTNDVSFDRPYPGPGTGQFFAWEHDLIMWMESEGYDVTYTTNIDLHTGPNGLLNHKAFISAGHDEYWSNQMYNAAWNARNNNIDLAFFGANAVYWQVELTNNNRHMEKIVRFRDSNRDERNLMGVHYVTCCSNDGNTDYIVQQNHLKGVNHTSWLFEGSWLRNGDRVPTIVGYEIDLRPDPNDIDASVRDMTLLSSSPYLGQNSHSIIFRDVSDAYVFASGTMSWSWALVPSRLPNGFFGAKGHNNRSLHRGLQVMTQNLLDRMAQ